MAAPARADVRVGLDVGRGERFAGVLDNDGRRLVARAVASDPPQAGALAGRGL